jgi:ribosome biogenesis protein SSF1/2
MCGPLGVSHLLLFTRSSSGNTNMRLARSPRGPTLSFRVEKYSLCKDILRSQKHPRTGGHDYQFAPLLVMNNFITPESAPPNEAIPKRLEKLVTEMFQSMFPPIAPQSTPLSSIRRVLLLNREKTDGDEDDGSYVINLRHYAITTKVTGIPKAIRRLNAAEKMMTSRDKRKKGLPNLGGLEDIADYMLDPSGAGYTSASESEVETDAEVEVLPNPKRKVLDRRERERLRAKEEGGEDSIGPKNGVEKRAVKLMELGPRMRLRLVKVEDDLCAGKVLWHEFVTKSKEEEKKLDEKWEVRRKEKEERRRIQRENVEKKRKERKEKGEDDDMEDEEDDEFDEYDMDDDVWHDGKDGNKDEDDDENEDEDVDDDEGGVDLDAESSDEEMEDAELDEEDDEG